MYPHFIGQANYFNIINIYEPTLLFKTISFATKCKRNYTIYINFIQTEKKYVKS